MDDDALLDSLAHPTLSGRWLSSGRSAGFALLADELKAQSYLGACAIGLAGIEDYSHQDFIAACRAHPGLIPIAGFDPARDASPEALRALRAMGYLGIKIHPRFSGLTRRLATLGPALRAAGEAGLVVFFCTYQHCGIEHYPDADPLASLVAVLREAPATRVVLVHGGDVDVLRYAQLVRHNPQLLLDLSLTLMKFPGSSVDADLAFLFNHFDRRICIGSDWPEYGLAEVRARFDHFAAGLAPDKRRNIAQSNLLGFLGLRREDLSR
ncbi:amidohydrolase family protein [Paucibacter sp. XJ19-41]|uniref:amidohydrolase family protein n=1 Tax=Paucibacter sp. XJ19-41 TaxID=2927824 RepID=UPI00234A217D|nr:amidohydrolase family protein [Paucibacter sp. XJ19-41]MDC6169160.1 amidohydrolase family protein [Paucibacter sp. XJ19-41]